MKDSRSGYKRVVLVAAVGTSPAVLTETVWALAHGDKPLIPDQIVVITTAQGHRSIESELLSGRPSVWAMMTAALAREKIPGAAALKLGSTDVRVVPDADNNEAEDLRSVGDNLRAADFMLGELRKHTEDPDTVVYASIAGGRKTMSALLLSCMSLLAREDDKVFHVLTVPEPIGFAPKYYFPQKGVSHVYKDKDKERRIASAKVKVELFEVPFVPVRGWFREKFNTLPPRYSEMVHALRAGGPRAVAYPEIEFAYERGVLKSVSQGGCAFIEVSNEGGLARTLAVNGVQTRLAYADGTLEILPRTVEGRVETASRPRLVSCRTADLDPFEYAYDGNYLSEVRCGAFSEKFTVQRETLAERRRNIRAAQPKGGVEHTGKVAGRLLSDGDYSYAYGRLRPNGGGTRVTLENRLGETAVFDLDRNTGVFDLTEFSGRKYTIHYFMRYDVAYLGWIQRVVDGRGRDVVSSRYDAKTGRPVRIRDRLGNDRLFEYDGAGRLVRESRRARGVSAIEPVKSLAYDLRDNPVAVSLLDADGRAAMTVTAEYDGENRPVHVSDGRRAVSLAYSKGGYPVSLTGDDGPIAEIRYGDFNRPVSRRNADGIETRLSYNAAGLVSRVERRDADGVISFLEVSYDGAGRPVSLRDHRGSVRRFERDALGNVAREFFPDGAGVGYARDALGRLVSVLDENGHEIKFAWDRFGLASRTTAVGQLTSYVRDGSGLLTESSSSRDGRTDRCIRREYDGYDRVVKAAYAKDEVETFAYDAWGRLARHTRGKRAETYAYDHFGRLVERCEDGVRTTFAYDAWGCRTRRRTVDARGRLLSDETRRYDARGRLSGIESDGAPIAYAYDRRGRVASQTVAGRRIVFAYTRHGRLASKTLMGPDGPVSELKYLYARDGRLEARLANGELRRYFHDARGRLVAVQDRDGEVLEKYEYDPAGNILAKTVGGRRTEYEYDAANQLVSSGDDFARTEYAYDAAGRLVREGTKTYRYGWLDKVLAVSDGDGTRTFGWHVDGQLASATHGGRTEDFTWDGLALVRRGGESFVNEPHVGGGAAAWSSGGGVLFNDLLATTLGAQGEDGAYTPFARTSFGEDMPRTSGTSRQSRSFFTGKPHVEGLGHAFLLRAYRPDLGKWLVADPLGYPDGWNQLAYCNNRVMEAIDWLGMWEYITLRFDQLMVFSPCVVIPEVQSTFDIMGVPKDIFTKL